MHLERPAAVSSSLLCEVWEPTSSKFPTLPQCSSGSLVGWPFLSENKSSTQQSIVPDIHQRIDSKETATAEISSQHGVSTHNQYNPRISDFHFPGTPAVEEKESKSIYVQQTSEASDVFKYKNFLYSDAGISGFEANNPRSLADQSLLPGFQQTFGRRNALMNQMSQHNKDLSQVEYCGLSRTNEASCSTGNLIHPTNIAEQTEPFSFTTLTFDDAVQNQPFSTNSLYCNSEENILNISETENPNVITDDIWLPITSNISITNQESQTNLDVIKFKGDDNNPKNKQCTEFSYGITNSDSNQTHQHNFGSEIITSNTELRTWEYSSSVTCSSENQKACNISTTTTANDSNAIHKNHSDRNFSRNVNSSKNLDTPSGNARKESYRRILPKDHLAFPVAKRYKCNFCDKTYPRRSDLSKHVHTHNDDKPYKCAKCGKSYNYPYQLRDHSYKHTGDSPHSCGECGKCFVDKSNLRVHLRSHAGERPYACNKCSKRYSQNVDLKCHMLKHADEERRKCDSCGAEFSSEDSLEAHKCTKNK
ncbi:hypothetical protein CDAR_175421 [Caerostris darwini]|uniref:C2H2-type domain-containing protein n=1 Tax=Caerostris darwini TaxID=1538125 RepID=A0AAV4VZ68_9ARAC|nr:hypothetical protein CDAR_175421 [Caerostris darwini]